jgi:ABC-2 type transport system ATP-binding protein
VPTLTFEHLSKSYTGTIAVDDASFAVPSGCVFGLLGPNGAGKTTLLRMLMGIIAPDAGRILLDGRPIGPAERDRVGYLPEERGLYRKERVLDVLIYFGMLKGLDRRAARDRARDWLERVGLEGAGSRRVEELSKGNQQKVQIAGTLLHGPEVLVMDEPFSGLDPLNAVLVKEILLERTRAGVLVILSTHQMPLVETLCERVVMIDHGRVVLDGDLAGIRSRHGEPSVLVDAGGDLDGLPAAQRVVEHGALRRIVLKPGARPRDLLEQLAARRVPVEHFEIYRAPLEEIFVRLARATRGGPGAARPAGADPPPAGADPPPAGADPPPAASRPADGAGAAKEGGR